MRLRIISFTTTLAAALMLAGCQSISTTATSHATEFLATLTSQQEVPPIQSDATGTAWFSINKDGKSISYRLSVKNINNVTMAHLHLGSANENGEHVAWLYPTSGQAPREIVGVYSDLLAKGTITANDLVEKLKGQPLSKLIDAIRHGDVYVQIHTKQHPKGEIRGQLRPTGQD